MRAVLDVTWFLFGVTGWVLMGVTLFHDNWKTTFTFKESKSGLWSFGTFLGLPAHIHVCRALMFVAFLLGGVTSIVLGLMKIGRMLEHKVKISVTGGGLFILSGLCTLIAVSLYASRVVQEFKDPLYPQVKVDFGTALFLGWAASTLAILGGSMLCVSTLCCCCDPPRPQAPAAQYPTTHNKVYRPQAPAAQYTTTHNNVYRPPLYV